MSSFLTQALYDQVLSCSGKGQQVLLWAGHMLCGGTTKDDINGVLVVCLRPTLFSDPTKGCHSDSSTDVLRHIFTQELNIVTVIKSSVPDVSLGLSLALLAFGRVIHIGFYLVAPLGGIGAKHLDERRLL